MKKVGIVSCYFKHNYGSMLQAYATQMMLDKLEIRNETINISGFNHEIKKRKIKFFIKATFKSDILLAKVGMAKTVLRKKLIKDDFRRNSKIRSEKFEHFSIQYFRLSSKCNTLELLSDLCKNEYSTVLVGSDQLWLPLNIEADYYTLNFVPDDVNSVAYATSFGVATLPKDSEKKAKKFLTKIKHIGVREESGKVLIKNLIGRDVGVVCDPTLLFTGNEWMEIQEKEPNVKGEYVLCYFLGNNSAHRKFAYRLKERIGIKIVALVHLDEYVKLDEEYADITPYDVGPSEFLNLIRNAKYVCTDSFHCSVFSILYKKDFFTFKRYADNTKQATNSRLDTLFKSLGISNRLLQGDENIEECLSRKINYEIVHDKLEIIKRESLEYVKTVIQ